VIGNRSAVLLLSLVLLLGGCATGGATHTNDDGKPNAAQLNLELGLGYLRQGDRQRALEKLRRSEEMDPRNPITQSTLALLYAELREDGNAESHFRRALSLAPNDSVTHTNYGSFLCSRGRYDEALSQYRASWKNNNNPNPEVAYSGAGTCMLNAGRPGMAEGYLQKALVANRHYPYALLQMAELTFRNKQYMRTRAYLQRYADVAQPNARSLWLGYRTERALGDRAASDRDGIELMKRFPRSDEALKLRDQGETTQ